MRIMVDMDSTIADLLGKFIADINCKFDKDLKESDFDEYNISKVLKKVGFTDYEIIYSMKLFNQIGYFEDLKPLGNSVQILKSLHAEGHDIYLVSNAMLNPNSMIGKMNWIATHLPFAIPVFTPDKSCIIGDIAIDDYIVYLEQYQCPNKLLIDAPYNKKATKYLRVLNNNWDSVYYKIHEMIEISDLVNDLGIFDFGGD